MYYHFGRNLVEDYAYSMEIIFQTFLWTTYFVQVIYSITIEHIPENIHTHIHIYVAMIFPLITVYFRRAVYLCWKIKSHLVINIKIGRDMGNWK